MYTTIELESLKAEANEEHRKHREDVGRLITMLKAASQERDEAKEHLQNILDKLIPSNPTESLTFLPQSQSGNPSITESNSLSDHTHNHRSHGSSPVDSFFDAIACPDFSSINMGFASSTFVKEYDQKLRISWFRGSSSARDQSGRCCNRKFCERKSAASKRKPFAGCNGNRPSSSNTTSCRPTSTVEKSSSITTVQDATCFHYH
ncbi:hypothetical protein OIU78_001883 [Salix suchowensis]|nr:hypothetical protein OIU78_001883 [Salix suchowensis]